MHGVIGCISDDFRSAACCAADDQGCLEQYRWCAKGVNDINYWKLLCPQTDCPGGNSAIRYKHESWGNTAYHRKTWNWDWSLDGYHCRMLIEADPGMNGKLHLEVLDTGWQKVEIMMMPGFMHTDQYWGLYDNGNRYTADEGQTWTVPTDWVFMVYYRLDYDKLYGSQTIELKTWVAELEGSDQRFIDSIWQPTGANYISPEEKARIERER